MDGILSTRRVFVPGDGTIKAFSCGTDAIFPGGLARVPTIIYFFAWPGSPRLECLTCVLDPYPANRGGVGNSDARRPVGRPLQFSRKHGSPIPI